LQPPPDQEWHLDSHLGRRVLVFARLDSTNSLAARLAAEGAPEGVAVLADEQTAGRGQHGRSWLSAPKAGVLLSLVLRPPPALARPSILTVWSGVAVCSLVQSLTGVKPALKWPNDVLLGGKKVCGVLIEQTHAVIVGIGLNVTGRESDLDAAGLPHATALGQYLRPPPDTHEVARLLLAQLDDDYEELGRQGPANLVRRWVDCLGLLGREVSVELATGGPLLKGVLTELNFDRLTLQTPKSQVELPPEMVSHLAARDARTRANGAGGTI
jgi:BirA family biotin operon repressor/biotin-[acetyl-CoA-carboxylase] ligase